MDNANKMDCPFICPGVSVEQERKVYKGAGSSREGPATGPYVPGLVTPYEPDIKPHGAPPRYLPQPTDSSSGDILSMTPVGPWAPGHLDWSPTAGSTGLRPVVDKYSITRYSTGEWRKTNDLILRGVITEKGRKLTEDTKKKIVDAFDGIGAKSNESTGMLEKRIKDMSYWTRKVEKSLKAMDNEIEALETDRRRLKGASRMLMMPESIAKECIELRTNRLEPDLVRDDAEQELIKEYAIVGEIRRLFQDTLRKVDIQIEEDRAAKASIESDWSDKIVSLKVDKTNLKMGPDSTLILKHQGVNRWPENATSLQFWQHFVAESIRNCDEVRKKSEKLRDSLMNAIIKAGQDMKIQSERTNEALSETIEATEGCCEALEGSLKDNLQKIADIENLLDHLRDSLRQLDLKCKQGQTRLKSRNYDRPNVENCRDEAQYALMGEIKYVYETVEALKDRVRQADAVRSELMMFRGQLEKQIACKRKSLNIDKDRLGRIRAHMPKPEEFVALDD